VDVRVVVAHGDVRARRHGRTAGDRNEAAAPVAAPRNDKHRRVGAGEGLAEGSVFSLLTLGFAWGRYIKVAGRRSGCTRSLPPAATPSQPSSKRHQRSPSYPISRIRPLDVFRLRRFGCRSCRRSKWLLARGTPQHARDGLEIELDAGAARWTRGCVHDYCSCKGGGCGPARLPLPGRAGPLLWLFGGSAKPWH
jgi:hypothetical protein